MEPQKYERALVDLLNFGWKLKEAHATWTIGSTTHTGTLSQFDTADKGQTMLITLHATHSKTGTGGPLPLPIETDTDFTITRSQVTDCTRLGSPYGAEAVYTLKWRQNPPDGIVTDLQLRMTPEVVNHNPPNDSRPANESPMNMSRVDDITPPNS